ncbi:VOC family protein [Occallatibacter riparius]|uniref:VOC family protein n=1 Tax=Occallatibacter riparius TaxID=1002689 RepID=A0A9J7BJX4_9BACT|nr:VOC family protein [Occallatibacter riparius]UWZ83128.1 VOC family protein [Occallatibacter riparius]
MAIEVTGVAPLVQVFDVPKSIRFYRDVLGFAVTERAKAKQALSNRH